MLILHKILQPTGLLTWGRQLLAITIGLMLVYLYVSCFQDCLVDDAFITLNYAKTLRDTGNWGFYPDRVTNTATSPLNVLLIAGMGMIVQDLRQSVIWLSAVAFTLILIVLMRIARQVFNSPYFGIAAFGCLLTNPLLLSTLGLESLLYAVGLVFAFYCLLKQDWSRLAISAALLTLTRPDGTLLMIVVVGFLVFHAPRKVWGVMGWYLVSVLPWYLFSWIRLGSLAPDTFFIKIFQTWGTWDFKNGLLLYVQQYPLETVCSFLMVPAVAAGFWITQPRLALTFRIFVVFGILYCAGYSILGVPPYAWYYAPVAVVSILLAWLALAVLLKGKFLKLACFLAPMLSLIGLLPAFGHATSRYLEEAPIHGNWASQRQYREIGEWFTEHLEPGSVVEIRAEIGTIAYYAPQRFNDVFSNRAFIKQWVIEPTPRSRLIRMLKAINFYWFDLHESPPTPSYVLMAEDPVRPAGEIVKQWRIASKWIPDGMTLVLIRREEIRSLSRLPGS